MSNKNGSANDRWRRYKLAAIPVLAILLLVRVYMTLAHRPATTPVPVAPINAPIVNPVAEGAKQNAISAYARWPKLPVNEVVASNPFAAWTPAEAAASTQAKPVPTDVAKLEPMQVNAKNADVRTKEQMNLKVQAIYHDGDNTAAIIDSRIVHVGDVLDEGVTVKDITSDRIILER